jgi:hypothetical protein
MQEVVKASARKSLGEYKPLIVYPSGKTEVCEKSPDRFDRHTKHGVIKGNRMARGNTYETKEEAIAAAQHVIDIRRNDALRRIELYSKYPERQDSVRRIIEEAKLWGASL